jgi:hypothetical protein
MVRNQTKKQPIGPPGWLGVGRRAYNPTSYNLNCFETSIIGEAMTQIRAEAPQKEEYLKTQFLSYSKHDISPLRRQAFCVA